MKENEMQLIIYYHHCCFRFVILICDTEIVASQKFFDKPFYYFFVSDFPCDKDLNSRHKCLFEYVSKTLCTSSPYLKLSFIGRQFFLLTFAMRHTYIKGSLLLAFGLGLRWARTVTESQNKDIYFMLSQFWMSLDSQKWTSAHVPDYSQKKMCNFLMQN